MGLDSICVYADKLLAIAAVWRERAGGTGDPYHGDVLLRAAEQLELAAARAKRTNSPYRDCG